jgi:hypothetical protein
MWRKEEEWWREDSGRCMVIVLRRVLGKKNEEGVGVMMESVPSLLSLL